MSQPRPATLPLPHEASNHTNPDASAAAGMTASVPIILHNLLSGIPEPALEWEPFRDGIEIARLYRTASPGPVAAFLRYSPGARLERHEHTGFEHILILSGSQTDDNGEHVAGTLLIHPPGTSHAIVSERGCVVLAFWERPVSFLE